MQKQFSQFNFIPPVEKAVLEAGYQTPSPIQEKTIPHILSHKDVLGQAQTGTGKTAAFALPLLNGLDIHLKKPQILVLTPTRELAIQVSDSFIKYGKYLKDLSVTTIYGGVGYEKQIKALSKGTHIIVGTPGRVIDHLKKGKINLSMLKSIVLDEADEMLNMGFLEDVDWILSKTPKSVQVNLFSATMPKGIKDIADTYLKDPVVIKIKTKVATADNIHQQYVLLKQKDKGDALDKILKWIEYDAVIIFARTKEGTNKLAEQLLHLGYKVAPLNGDISQDQRERTIKQLKKSLIDIVIATDVAARGLDVERITHVINFDTPFDAETYIHRIGRTGRAGRHGESLLFITPKEKKMISIIESVTKKEIKAFKPPKKEAVNLKRINHFKSLIQALITKKEEESYKESYKEIISGIGEELNIDPMDIACALALKIHHGESLLMEVDPSLPNVHNDGHSNNSNSRAKSRNLSTPHNNKKSNKNYIEKDMERYKIQIGTKHKIRPKDIVGALANEGEINGDMIGRISIEKDFSTVDLPKGLSKKAFNKLKDIAIAKRPIHIKKISIDKPKGQKSKSKRPLMQTVKQKKAKTKKN